MNRKRTHARPDGATPRAGSGDEGAPSSRSAREAPPSGSDASGALDDRELEAKLSALRGGRRSEAGQRRIASPIGYTRKHGGLPPTRKSLGQFWLEDPQAAREIVAALELQPGETVIEVGPGAGALTVPLLETGARVIAVEIDRRMVEVLRRLERDHPGLRVVHADILEADLSELAEGGRFSLTGNLPYHITSSLLFRLLDHARHHPGTLRRAVVMMQFEVARRIAAGPGESEYGILSVFTRLWGEPELAFTVPADRFRPAPKVDAGVLKLDFAAEPRYPLPHWPTFKRLVKGTFGKRRKMLRNSLPGIAKLGPWEGLDFDWSRRPQTLSAAEFSWLAERLVPHSAAHSEDQDG